MSQRPIYGFPTETKCPTPSEVSATYVTQYLTRLKEILTTLESDKNKETALQRLNILKEEAQITLTNIS